MGTITISGKIKKYYVFAVYEGELISADTYEKAIEVQNKIIEKKIKEIKEIAAIQCEVVNEKGDSMILLTDDAGKPYMTVPDPVNITDIEEREGRKLTELETAAWEEYNRLSIELAKPNANNDAFGIMWPMPPAMAPR